MSKNCVSKYMIGYIKQTYQNGGYLFYLLRKFSLILEIL